MNEKVNKLNTFQKFKAEMQGKTFSILGDSISTFEGYSNNSTQTNSTIANNCVRYGPVGSGKAFVLNTVSETWWMQIADQLSMKLCVNNSSGGSMVNGTGSNNIAPAYLDRCVQLHMDANRENNQIVNPEYIMVYMGVNDIRYNKKPGNFEDINFRELIKKTQDGIFSYATPNNFAEAYAIMIHKMKTKYPNSKIFVFNLPKDFGSNHALQNFNNTIFLVSKKFGCFLADLNTSKMGGDCYAGYTFEGVHPNAIGMDIMTDVMIDAMFKTFKTDK